MWSWQAGDRDQQGGRVEGGDVVAGPVVEDLPLGEGLFDQHRGKRRDEQLPVEGDQPVAEGQQPGLVVGVDVGVAGM